MCEPVCFLSKKVPLHTLNGVGGLEISVEFPFRKALRRDVKGGFKMP